MKQVANRPERTDRVVSFDLDDTLIRGPFSHVLIEVAESVAQSPAEVAGLRTELQQRHLQLLDADDLGAYDWHQIVADTFGGRAGEFDLLERLEHHAAANLTQVLHDDTPSLLEELHDSGWRVVLVTNGWRRYQEPVLRHVGLLDVLDEVITSDDVGIAKPAGQIFARARAGASDHVHVGDRIDHDIVGGHRAGARTALLRTDTPDDPAEHEPYLHRLWQKFRVGPDDERAARPDLMTSRLVDVVSWLRA